MEKVNRKRAQGVNYVDCVTSKDVNEYTKKKPFRVILSENVVVWCNKDGYCTGNYMIFQSKDCIYYLRVLYGDRYDFVFLFYHSSGHAKKQVNGKDATKTKKLHSGRLQHPTFIKDKKRYLWSFHEPTNTNMAQVVKDKLINWDREPGPSGGPFYLTPSDRLAHWEDQLLPLVTINMTKEELIDEIVAKTTDKPTTNHSELINKDEKAINNIAKKLQIPFSENITHKTVDLYKNELVDKITNEAAAAATLICGRIGLSKETLKHIRKITSKLNIDTTKVITHLVKYGIKNKGRGLVQVLWQRFY